MHHILTAGLAMALGLELGGSSPVGLQAGKDTSMIRRTNSFPETQSKSFTEAIVWSYSSLRNHAWSASWRVLVTKSRSESWSNGWTNYWKGMFQ